VEFIDGCREFGEKNGAEMAAEVSAVLIEREALLDEILPLCAARAGVGPFSVTAAPPIGEIVLRERASAEFFGEDALDFGQGVEPGEEFRAVRAVFEAAV